MKKGGVGGGRTTTGLRFENKVGLIEAIEKLKDYEVVKSKLSLKGKMLGLLLRKHNLYKFLFENGIDYSKYLSAKLLPDDSIYLPNQKKFIVLEFKFQGVGGSTDEKLQTCHFKIRQYRKLIGALDKAIMVEYIYVFNDFFRAKRYRDVLQYISEVDGCSYYFNGIPLGKLGLTASGV